MGDQRNEAIIGAGRAALSRRAALALGGAGLAGTLAPAVGRRSALAQQATPAAALAEDFAGVDDVLAQEAIEAFRVLPGARGMKLWAPPMGGAPEWSAALDPDRELFIASAFKATALAECLRMEEAAIDPASGTPVMAQLNRRLATQLPLDESVFSPSAPVLNPPNLTGTVTLRTALEAMISHSDNTATDIVLKHVGADRVQGFVDGIGLANTRIPESTRQFMGYVFGLEDWQATTWQQTQEDTGTAPRPIVNDTITMASTADDLVSFYARALQGEFFRYAETLTVFRAILSLPDAIGMVMPLGANGFAKGGSLDLDDGQHAMTLAGGMFVPDRWIYYALLLNWTDEDHPDPGAVVGQYVASLKTIFGLVAGRLGRA